jgi:TatD DNase family protein
MIDTHAHIYSDKFAGDRDAMLERAFEQGLSRIYMPNIDHTSIDGMLELEEQYPGKCFAMMGLHPCSVDAKFEKELYIVEEWLGKRDFVGVGEMGIDLYWDKTYLEQQREAFRIQAGWAKQYKRPLIIHTRESMGETIALLEELADESLFGIVHCFTGNLDEAKQIIELGFHLGIGGVATFKKGGLDKVIPHIDLKHLVLETDSPYLAPTPHRGKRNEPAYVNLVAQKVAGYKALTVEEVETQTDQNALALFGELVS